MRELKRRRLRMEVSWEGEGHAVSEGIASSVKQACYKNSPCALGAARDVYGFGKP